MQLALELLDQGTASRIWTADSATTSLWASPSYGLVGRLAKSDLSDPAWNYLQRVRSTFVPPADTAGVARCLDLLARVESSGWQDHAVVVPIFEARRDACSKAATDGSGLVEVVKFSCSQRIGRGQGPKFPDEVGMGASSVDRVR